MKRFVSAVLVTCLVASPCYADDKVPEPVISPLREGQPAPFTGVLFSQGAAASVVADIMTTQDKIDAASRKAAADATANVSLEMNELRAQCKKDKTDLTSQVMLKDREIARQVEDLRTYDEQVKKLKADMPSRSTWFTIGLVSGMVATVATVFAVNQATK